MHRPAVWGKVFAAVCGFLIFGPIGAFAGIFIGHLFDLGLHRQALMGNVSTDQLRRIQQCFFRASFSVMGCIAKADGRVSENEIRLARRIMQRMHLTAEQQQQAIKYFNQGKQANFNLNAMLYELKTTCHGQQPLLQMFIEIQVEAAQADGGINPNVLDILNNICQQLEINTARFYGFSQRQHSTHRNRQYRSSEPPRYQQANALSEAYSLLEISESATDAEIKRAYRKLMSQNHPDKLVSKGLPEEMIKLANEKTQKISAAYDLIKRSRQRA